MKRGQLAAYDEACELVARMRRLDAEKQALEALKEKRQALKGEIDWQDGEFASITEQLVSKQAQADSLIAKKSRMEIAIDEQKKAEELKRRNNELTESMGKLNVQLDRLETKKVNLKNNLADVEQSIAEIRQSMESFNIPEQSIGELMENVRAEVKITEIRAQTDRLQTEIAARESDIADKELTISGQTKQLNSLMALDSTVAPLKAKDAIVSVIDAKIDKLTLINDSLKEKLNNFRRALEDNGFQEMRLEQSSESISTVLVRKQFAKEEEFKRQVLLAGREEPDNISVMSALPAQLDDPEIERLKSDLANRTMDRQGKCNYVTNMDLSIQSFLCERLGKLYPSAKFIAEENNGPSEKFNCRDDFFIIDPIDGTTNCLHNYASCAVCVAYVSGGETLFGAVYSLADDELFYAAAGCGAYLNGRGVRVSNNGLERSLVCIGTASHDYGLLNDTFLIARDMFNGAEDVRRSGSAALDICNVACGRAEVFYEMRLYPWDYAAAQLILLEAGGKATDFYGQIGRAHV